MDSSNVEQKDSTDYETEESTEKEKKGYLKFTGSLLFIGVLLSKFGKGLLIFGKPLLALLKLSKFGTTFISMLITVAVYSMLYGWLFALGFVILLFIHENGHMWAAKKIGLPVSKPVFIPFMGAFITMKEMPKTAKEEAIIGFGGPLLGGLAAIGCFGIYYLTGSDYWLALGYIGCFLNLFNLAPLGFLDGGRITTAVSLWLWIPGAIILTVLAFRFGNPIIFMVLGLGLYQSYKIYKDRHNPEQQNYYQVEPEFRFKMGAAYLILLVLLGVGMGLSLEYLNPEVIKR